MSGSNGDMTAAFASALESADSGASSAETSPVSTPESVETPAASSEEATAAATAQPAAETTTPESVSADEKPKGEPPAWRWQDILKNAREESARAARQEVEQQYAELRDFQGLSPDERAGLKVWQRAMAGDPAAQAHIRQAQQHNPQLASVLRGLIAEQQAQAQQDPEPEPDAAIRLDDGTTVPVYTAEGQRKRDAWLRRQLAPELKSQLAEEFKPLATTADQIRQMQQQAELQQASTQWAATVLAPISKLPYFDEFKPELGKALAGLPETATDSEMQAAIYDAYTRLHTAKLESLTKQGEQNALASIHKRAVAGTSNPNTAQAQQPKKFRPGAEGFAEALEHFGATAS